MTETATIDAAQTTATADETLTPSIPVIGDEVILLECQFCVDNMAHALLVIPEVATFELATTTAGADIGCNTVDTFNGRQVVLCRVEENTSITVNICTDGTNCTELLVDLQACPVSANTPEPGGATNTPEPGAATTTDTPQPSPTTGGATSTPTP